MDTRTFGTVVPPRARRRQRSALCAVLCAVGFAASPLAAQTSSAPPPMPAAKPDTAKPGTARPAAPPRSIQLSPSERQALDEAAERKDKAAAAATDGLAPTAEDIKPRPDSDFNTTRIEQTRTWNRITEVIVTPAGQTHSYVMVNREGRMPYGTTQMNSGLSVPMFFRFEFGKPTPATNLPPPPSPSR